MNIIKIDRTAVEKELREWWEKDGEMGSLGGILNLLDKHTITEEPKYPEDVTHESLHQFYLDTLKWIEEQVKEEPKEEEGVRMVVCPECYCIGGRHENSCSLKKPTTALPEKLPYYEYHINGTTGQCSGCINYAGDPVHDKNREKINEII